MSYSATFYFHASLNDFIARSTKHTWITYRFNNIPAVKDAIEAIGIPHPEVNVVLINNKPVNIFHPLRADDKVEVYPFDANQNWQPGYSLKERYSYTNTFVLDVHLGKLAKALRMLGFDTAYENNYADETIVDLADAEKRIVLTRDTGLLKHKLVEQGYWLRSQQVNAQLAEVIVRFELAGKFKPFTRCMACNGMIEAVAKSAVSNVIPENTATFFNEFWQCANCKRVYWKGSHHEKMEKMISKLVKDISSIDQ